YKRVTRRLPSNIQGTLIPDRTYVTLKYNEDLSIVVPPGGIMANYLFRCNSIFDPNYTGTGHQPLGHDQYANFYKKYVVMGATITATFKALDNSELTNPDGSNYTVGITTIQAPAGVIVVPSDFQENNRTTYSNVCAQSPYTMVSKNFNSSEFFGLTKILDNEKYGADFGANPEQVAYWQLGIYQPSAPTTSGRMYVNVAIKYTLALRERVNVGGS
uniref:hypothetical protein n=1 Tax=Aliarcobacter sp. TaxID=2321116 RepID=UPI004047EBBF